MCPGKDQKANSSRCQVPARHSANETLGKRLLLVPCSGSVDGQHLVSARKTCERRPVSSKNHRQSCQGHRSQCDAWLLALGRCHSLWRIGLSRPRLVREIDIAGVGPFAWGRCIVVIGRETRRNRRLCRVFGFPIVRPGFVTRCTRPAIFVRRGSDVPRPVIARPFSGTGRVRVFGGDEASGGRRHNYKARHGPLSRREDRRSGPLAFAPIRLCLHRRRADIRFGPRQIGEDKLRCGRRHCRQVAAHQR